MGKVKREVLSNSRINTYRKCPRMYELKYVLGLKRHRDNEAALDGKSLHQAIELMLKGESERSVVRQVYAQYCEQDPVSAEYKSFMVVAIARAWRRVYVNDPLEYIAVEQHAEMPLKSPLTGRNSTKHRVQGFIDGIVRHRDGTMWVVDHKLTSDSVGAESDFVKRLGIDTQPFTYIALATHLGLKVNGFIYDLVRKPGIRPRGLRNKEIEELAGGAKWHGHSIETANSEAARIVMKPKAEWEMRETPPMYAARVYAEMVSDPGKYFGRHMMVPSRSELREWHNDLWMTKKLLDMSQNQGLYPKDTRSCLFPYRCDFADFCLNRRSIDNPGPEYTITPKEEAIDGKAEDRSTSD